MRITGTVKSFDDTKGVGTITPDSGGEDIFFHFTGIQGTGYRKLAAGQRVEYEAVDGKRGWQAVSIVAL